MRPVRIMSKEQAVAPPATQTLLFPLLYIWDLMNATVPPKTETPPPLPLAVLE
jgi:hypothetical protein